METTYEYKIKEAILSFNRNDELRKIIENVCYQDWMDKESTWAILECFDQKWL